MTMTATATMTKRMRRTNSSSRRRRTGTTTTHTHGMGSIKREKEQHERKQMTCVAQAGAAAGGGSSSGGGGGGGEEKKPAKVDALAPVAAATPVGEFLRHILEMEPQLFEASMDQQLMNLSQQYPEGFADAPGASSTDASGKKADEDKLVLYARIGEIRLRQRQGQVEDLMYAAVLQKFVNVGVDLLPPLDGRREYGSVDLRKLTVEVHSAEALDMVKSHLKQLLGPSVGAAFSTAMVKISKLQAAQVYAASIMFGYFLRKVDSRFRLERQMGTLPKTQEETIAALENLFNMDSAEPIDVSAADETGKVGTNDADSVASSATGRAGTAEGDGNELRRYIESFDQTTLNATARMVSREGMVLAERQTGALFGDIGELANQMQKALEEGVDGDDSPITSTEMLAERMNSIVSSDKVATITVSYATQKRVVLEAVAFGTFLRDVEEKVGSYELLTEIPMNAGGSGPMQFGIIDDDDDDDDDSGGGGDGGGGSKVPIGPR